MERSTTLTAICRFLSISYACWRYRQLTDNLIDALGYQMKQLEDESKARANKHFVAEQVP
jgi:hypothetical protein